jgi:hypothetical protein
VPQGTTASRHAASPDGLRLCSLCRLAPARARLGRRSRRLLSLGSSRGEADPHARRPRSTPAQPARRAALAAAARSPRPRLGRARLRRRGGGHLGRGDRLGSCRRRHHLLGRRVAVRLGLLLRRLAHADPARARVAVEPREAPALPVELPQGAVAQPLPVGQHPRDHRADQAVVVRRGTPARAAREPAGEGIELGELERRALRLEVEPAVRLVAHVVAAGLCAAEGPVAEEARVMAADLLLKVAEEARGIHQRAAVRVGHEEAVRPLHVPHIGLERVAHVCVEEALPPPRHPRLLLLVHPPVALLPGLAGRAAGGGNVRAAGLLGRRLGQLAGGRATGGRAAGDRGYSSDGSGGHCWHRLWLR